MLLKMFSPAGGAVFVGAGGFVGMGGNVGKVVMTGSETVVAVTLIVGGFVGGPVGVTVGVVPVIGG